MHWDYHGGRSRSLTLREWSPRRPAPACPVRRAHKGRTGHRSSQRSRPGRGQHHGLDLFVVVVLDLHHFFLGGKGPAESLDFAMTRGAPLAYRSREAYSLTTIHRNMAVAAGTSKRDYAESPSSGHSAEHELNGGVLGMTGPSTARFPAVPKRPLSNHPRGIGFYRRR